MTTDPIANFLTIIRNASMNNSSQVRVTHSKYIESILDVMAEKGFIESFSIEKDGIRSFALIDLPEGRKIALDRVSKPGGRKIVKKEGIKKIKNGYGFSIISTSHGVISDTKARELGIGGEIICNIYFKN